MGVSTADMLDSVKVYTLARLVSKVEWDMTMRNLETGFARRVELRWQDGAGK